MSFGRNQIPFINRQPCLRPKIGNLRQPIIIEQREMQVETAQHFHQPLVQQASGYQYQHPAGAASEQLLVDDHAGFDGLAQPDFVCQQDAWRVALAHFVGNVYLVRQQVRA